MQTTKAKARKLVERALNLKAGFRDWLYEEVTDPDALKRFEARAKDCQEDLEAHAARREGLKWSL